MNINLAAGDVAYIVRDNNHVFQVKIITIEEHEFVGYEMLEIPFTLNNAEAESWRKVTSGYLVDLHGCLVDALLALRKDIQARITSNQTQIKRLQSDEFWYTEAIDKINNLGMLKGYL